MMRTATVPVADNDAVLISLYKALQEELTDVKQRLKRIELEQRRQRYSSVQRDNDKQREGSRGIVTAAPTGTEPRT